MRDDDGDAETQSHGTGLARSNAYLNLTEPAVADGGDARDTVPVGAHLGVARSRCGSQLGRFSRATNAYIIRLQRHGVDRGVDPWVSGVDWGPGGWSIAPLRARVYGGEGRRSVKLGFR